MYKVILISLLGLLSFGFGKYPKQLPGYAIDRETRDTLQITFKVHITKKKLEFVRNLESLEIISPTEGKPIWSQRPSPRWVLVTRGALPNYIPRRTRSISIPYRWTLMATYSLMWKKMVR